MEGRAAHALLLPNICRAPVVSCRDAEPALVAALQLHLGLLLQNHPTLLLPAPLRNRDSHMFHAPIQLATAALLSGEAHLGA